MARPAAGGRRRDGLRRDDDAEWDSGEAATRRDRGLGVVHGGQLAEGVGKASFDSVADDDAGPHRESAKDVGRTLGGTRHPNIVGVTPWRAGCYGV